MFDTVSRQKLKVLSVTLLVVIAILILLVIVLPIMVKNKYLDNSLEKSTPHSDNTDLWAKFPGDLKTKLTHKIDIFEYPKEQSNEEKLKIKDTFTLEETVSYENFNFTDKEDTLLFDAKTTFSLPKNSKLEAKEINTLSMGLFETLETLTNPPLYQIGIDAIEYLLNKALGVPEIFIKQLFAYEAYTNLIVDDERIKSTLLRDIDPAKADLILSADEKYIKYSFKSISGLYQWIKIVADTEAIAEATWLNQVFGLTEEESLSVLAKGKYLDRYLIAFNKKLAYLFDCPKKTACGNEILYTQLMSENVTKYFGIENMVDLYSIVDPESWVFGKSPELPAYFEEYKKKFHEEIHYDNYTPSVSQLNKMIDTSSESCLLAANNSALFLELNKTGNSYKAYEIYTVSSNVMSFMADYFYDYLPSLFLYQEFEDETTHKKLTIEPIAKTYSTITQSVVDFTYGKLLNTFGVYNLVLSKLTWEYLKENFTFDKLTNEDIDDEDVCPMIMQQALDDGTKVLKICSDEIIGFNSPTELAKWFAPYPCVKSGDPSTCDMTVINQLKKIVYITDDEIKAIYGPELLGGAIDTNKEIVEQACECEGEECDDEYLAKIQFWQAKITKNLPEPYKADSISVLLPDYFPYPVELSYFQTKEGNADIPEEHVDYLISLASKGGNLLNEESSNALIKKIQLEREITSMLKNNQPKLEILSTIDILNNGYLFNNILYTNYKNKETLLQGSSEEEKRFIDFLSSGEFYENYKPGLKKTSGLNFGIDLETGEKKYVPIDRYGIYGKQTDTSHRMRRIISMNDFSVLNIKKEEYNKLSGGFSYMDSPIYDFQGLLEEYPFSDGFQYEHELDTIYYYDKISSRPFKFDYKEDASYKDTLKCRKYVLDTKDISININEKNDVNSKKAFISQKVNKPFIITGDGKNGLDKEIESEISKENYICVDVISNMVLDSKINLVYSIYTRDYGLINKKIESKKVLPVFTYYRNYEVDVDSYKENFPGVAGYYTFRTVFIIVGVILIVILFIIALVALKKMSRKINEEEIKENIAEQKLVPGDSRDPTIHG